MSSEKLNWNTFFKLRKTRRWYQLGSSVGSGLGGFVLRAQVLTHSDMDKEDPWMARPKSLDCFEEK
jgi:hypothetical protein